MKYHALGNTQLIVSQLCFGGLSISPLQACLPPEKGAELIAYAATKGINFLDTAELYGLYPTLKKAFRLVSHESLHVATKSYCHDKESAKRSVEGALEAMQIDYIDLFLLHEQESEHTLRGHAEAITQLQYYKKMGVVKHIGLSTHFVAGVLAGIKHEAIEVIHPIYNRKGFGIVDGSPRDMLDAIVFAHSRGVGIYGMKLLGGGHLIASAQEEINHGMSLDCFDAIAIGMKSEKEVDMNVALFSGQPVDEELVSSLQQNRQLLIHDWCIGCGACVEKCQQGALYLEDSKALVHFEKCVLCGYCATVCPEFCIKVL